MKHLRFLMMLGLVTTAYANDLESFFIQQMQDSPQEVLQDFWAGDDGEDCWEPQVEVLAVDMQVGAASVFVSMQGLAPGCYMASYRCDVSFSFDGNQVTFERPIDLVRDCLP